MISFRLGVRRYHRWVAPTLRAFKNKQDALPFKPPDHRSTYIEWNYKAEVYAFAKRLNEDIRDEILKQALVDRSYIETRNEELIKVGMEPDSDLVDNTDLCERGNLFIDNCVNDYLYRCFPSLPEKYIRQLKQYLTSDVVMSHISASIGLNDVILAKHYPLEKDILITGFKAVVAAIEKSSGESQCNLFIRDILVSQLLGMDLTEVITPTEPLNELDVELKSRGLEPVEPRLIGQAAVNTLLPVFYVGLYTDRKLIGKGFGESPEIAEEMAACDALWKMWGVSLKMKPLSKLLNS